ncbi:precorrin-2 C(20)-methyltransferase [Ectothiorhodospira lacustris]|uniref:precorrin-2 C(20)-methyltransferase n=1 Tax=Ectothiorhodospira lacustris TaxID=2899127 RepID=UPI001EE937C0|nr:precorrin-2 C(20)-methyltransferase [Ectothiorhodospira lacustris]MCG5499293.1 precorrin-2 C(20)-methyltransferase [Ectothiorhodospira lacustris]MCG5509182.1 precorrin-2 C(20)-methyltransferase [Ectothiorhodospira lacustris]MCG5520972.1 precorrin-2 C(20)-methyltransferase [Ectothiorhodospira lacustris]
MSGSGTLFGIGLGPGDPELITLKALRLLQAAPVVATFAKQGRTGQALGIAGPHLRPEQQILRLEYPFTTEVSIHDPRYARDMSDFYDQAAAEVAQCLMGGRDVAVICEGDPFLYGSYMYLHDRLSHRFPAQVVPGISGMSGCWTQADTPITHGDDVLTVIPGTLSEDAMVSHLGRTDAAVFMKVGRNLPRIRAALARAGLLERAMLVERGTMEGARVARLAECPEDQPAPYFTIVLVPGRQGVR